MKTGGETGRGTPPVICIIFSKPKNVGLDLAHQHHHHTAPPGLPGNVYLLLNVDNTAFDEFVEPCLIRTVKVSPNSVEP